VGGHKGEDFDQEPKNMPSSLVFQAELGFDTCILNGLYKISRLKNRQNPQNSIFAS